MIGIGTVFDIGDHVVEVVANPASHGDRYVIRVDCDPGGPGIKGDFPHRHPTLVETFKCLSGDMIVRAGREVAELPVGEKFEVPPGQVHGFLNVGSGQLIVESEVIFPNGYRPEHDLMVFAETYDRLKREQAVNDKTGEPPLLQMAVLTHAHRSVIRQPGVAGLLMPFLAFAGRLAGYSSEPFEDGPQAGR